MTAEVDRVPLESVRDLLRLGELLPFRVLDPHERLLLNAGHRLIDEAQFEALIERGAWAERPLVEAERASRAQAEGRAASAAPAVAQVSLFDRWELLQWQFDKLSRALARGEVAGRAVPAFWQELRKFVDTETDVALFLCMRQGEQRFALYAQHHAIHCAVVVLLAARLLRWSEQRQDSIGCAALTMNLSMLELQGQLARQATSPTPEQRSALQTHPMRSVRLLETAGVSDPLWLKAVLQHHECEDGSGYPSGTTEVGQLASLVRRCDVYTSKLSSRAYRDAIAADLAGRQMFMQDPGHPMTAALVKEFGIYPPGCHVRLASGELAVVVGRGATITAPLVACIGNARGMPLPRPLRRDTSDRTYAVTAVIGQGLVRTQMPLDRLMATLAA